MLAEPCPRAPASQYGIDNLKCFSEGKLPTYKSRSSDPDFALDRKAVEEPVSEFGKKLLQDFPSITKSEVRDITFNLLRSAAHAASLAGGSSASSSASKRHIRVLPDRKTTVVKRPPATSADLQPLPAAPPSPEQISGSNINIAALPYRTPAEGIARLELLPSRPYAFGAPRPWADSAATDNTVIVNQPPFKTRRTESPEAPTHAPSAATVENPPAATSGAASSSSTLLFPAVQNSPESAQPKKKPRLLRAFTSAEAVEAFINEDS